MFKKRLGHLLNVLRAFSLCLAPKELNWKLDDTICHSEFLIIVFPVRKKTTFKDVYVNIPRLENKYQDGPAYIISIAKKCPYSECFWSVFSRVRNEYGDLQSKSPHSVQMRENLDQKIRTFFLQGKIRISNFNYILYFNFNYVLLYSENVCWIFIYQMSSVVKPYPTTVKFYMNYLIFLEKIPQRRMKDTVKHLWWCFIAKILNML